MPQTAPAIDTKTPEARPAGDPSRGAQQVGKLQQWLAARERQAEARRSYDEALYSGRFIGYLSYRLRGGLLGTVTQLAVHALEFWLLFQFFVGFPLHIAFAAKLAGTLSGAVTWGLLESLRRQLRASATGRRQLLSAWLTVAVTLAQILGTVAVVWLGWAMLFHSDDATQVVVDVYVFVYMARIAADLPLRVLYSGTYAYGRVARPLWVGAATDVVGLILAVVIGRAAGPIGFVAATAATTALSRGATLHFVRRSYAQRQIAWPELSYRAMAGFFSAAFWSGRAREAAWLALAGVVMRTAETLALTLLLRRTFPQAEAFASFAFLYLVIPAMHAGLGLGQPFYTDLVDCEGAQRTHLRWRFLMLSWLGVGVFSTLVWLLGFAVLVLMGVSAFAYLWLWAWPLCVGLGSLSLWQMEAFTADRLPRLFAGAAVFIGVTLALPLRPLPADEYLLVAALPVWSALVTVVVWRRFERVRHAPHTWLLLEESLAVMRFPYTLVRVRCAKLDARRTRLFATQLGAALSVTAIAPRKSRVILAAARWTQEHARHVVTSAAGWVEHLDVEPIRGPADLARVLSAWRGPRATLDTDTLLARHVAAHPDSAVLDLRRGADKRFRALKRYERVALLQALYAFGPARVRGFELHKVSERGVPRALVFRRKPLLSSR